jgi:hypothetical protein
MENVAPYAMCRFVRNHHQMPFNRFPKRTEPFGHVSLTNIWITPAEAPYPGCTYRSRTKICRNLTFHGRQART